MLKHLSLSSPMARAMIRTIPLSLRPSSSKPPFVSFSPNFNAFTTTSRQFSAISGFFILNGGKWWVLKGNEFRVCCGFGGGKRGYRRLRRKSLKKTKELELSVKVLIEEGLPNDPEILSIAEMLQLNGPMAMKLALDVLKNPENKTRDTSINDVAGFETIELSLLLCNDEFIRKLNKEWRDEDHATDVLSMSQHIPELELPILMLGDIVISVETAAREAEERGHTLLDEIRILLVHGLLHLMGFDHELSEEAEEEMEKEEELLLKSLGWKGKGLIKSAFDAENDRSLHVIDSDDRKKEGSLRFYRPKFKYIFCDMDGTFLNSESRVSQANVDAVREALSRGVQVVVATGKARVGTMEILRAVDLVGRNGILSESSPGVFLQGLLVYGIQGREILRRNLDLDICRQAFAYSLENQIPLVAFCGDRCLTLFDHPRVESLHSVYREPKAEIMPSIGKLLETAEVQKLIFLDSAERVATTIRPYWTEASGEEASVVQAIPDMLEIVPRGTSKGNGVKLLLHHLGVSSHEIMAIGDGENDIEMLKIAKLGIALSNGSDKTKAVADVIGLSNDEDGVADAIYRYAF